MRKIPCRTVKLRLLSKDFGKYHTTRHTLSIAGIPLSPGFGHARHRMNYKHTYTHAGQVKGIASFTGPLKISTLKKLGEWPRRARGLAKLRYGTHVKLSNIACLQLNACISWPLPRHRTNCAHTWLNLQRRYWALQSEHLDNTGRAREDMHEAACRSIQSRTSLSVVLHCTCIPRNP